MFWQCGEYRFDLAARPLVMGILNLSPDSFSDGYGDPGRAIAQAESMIQQGADIIDLGGESTRPGSDSMDTETEWARIAPVLERLVGQFKLPVSVDTQKVEVARRAVDGGASIINHVSATLDVAEMLGLLQSNQVGYVAMHMPQRPKTMQQRPEYGDVVSEVTASLGEVGARLLGAGIAPERLLYDPGIGFGKNLTQNLALMAAVERLAAALNRPLLMGVSRKSWLQRLFEDAPLADMHERDAYTAVAAVLLPHPAVAVHRVHQPGWIKNALTMRAALARPQCQSR